MHPGTEWQLMNWIDHVVAEYHQPLPEEIAGLEDLAARLETDPGGPALAPILVAADELYRELLLHVGKEEQVLFPWLRSGRGVTAGGPIQVMTLEHQEARQMMDELRDAARTALTGASAAARAWADAYLAFDVRLREHMRIEEEELFPRALAGR
jgi:regulator of cell morphogenesis and NO signaling